MKLNTQTVWIEKDVKDIDKAIPGTVYPVITNYYQKETAMFTKRQFTLMHQTYEDEIATRFLMPTTGYFLTEQQMKERDENGEWIEVKDGCELPENADRVLCRTHTGLVEVGYYSEGWQRDARFESFRYSGYEITHWHPLPAPPIQSIT